MQHAMIGRRLLLLGAATVSQLPRARADDAAPDLSGGTAAAGQLLVASPEMTDPRFVKTVILIVAHDADGAMGLVINRPVEIRALASVLDAIGEDAADVEGTIQIFAGGPVDANSGFVLHTADYRNDATMPIDLALSITSSSEILRDIGHKRGPLKSLFAFGYAGWGPGQLEAELAVGGWLTAAADPKLIFDDDRDGLWDEATARRTVPL